MHVLVFRHVPFEHPGLITPALAARQIASKYADLPGNPDQPLEWESARALLFMGGPMSANDDSPFIRREQQIIREAFAAGKPIMGVCLGAQLIARSLGAKVYKNLQKEIGWAPVHWTEPARRDPLMAGLSEPEMLFHWHGETFDLPEGAEWLAWSDRCRNQAFQIRSRTYGFQFHLEVTPAMIGEWCSADANAADVRELAAPIDAHAHASRLAELAAQVFGRWADMISAT